MELKHHSEYFIRTRNKVSLVVWVLINNNPVTSTVYTFLQAVELAFNFVLILALYSQANVYPNLSDTFLVNLDFNVESSLSVISIAVSGILFFVFCLMVTLMIRHFSWETYSDKRLAFKLCSLIVTVSR